MDLEAMQLLNLSPIPELSEIELSTMLDHLSGLSDINGDLTDRNVEDIIKEAEDLLDKSIGSKTNESKSLEKTPDEMSDVISENVNQVKEESSTQESEKTNHSSELVPNYNSSHSTPNEIDKNKHFTSPVGSPQSKVYSPGGPINHIKSTIDSLKEFSTLIEQKLNSQNSSPKSVNKTITKKNESKEISTWDNQSIISPNQLIINPKTVKVPEDSDRENKSLNKSIKLLNCFERLYQVKPVRLTTSEKPKTITKGPKSISKKKISKDLKNPKRTNQKEKSFPSSLVPSAEEEILNQDTRLRYFHSKNLPETAPEDKIMEEHWTTNPCLDGSSYAQTQSIDEKLIIKVLEEMEEIKDHVKKVGTIADNQNTKGLRSSLDVEPTECKENSGIQRLEQQFSMLKEKYEYQMGKLEAENQRLKEALLSQKLSSAESEIPIIEAEQQTENSDGTSLKNCKTPRNSPSSSQENLQMVKDAFSQTEEVKYAEEVETKKTEDKENFGGKKKPWRCKPFTDVNLRQKKAFEYETQLLATVRGLQAEVTAKDKENKKLKNEIESVKKQMKKLTGAKVENWKKCNIGIQTIGLGPVVQKPYNPGEYEAREDFERENEHLRTRITALEEDLELLKQKRISDLQALHQVHEEEMSKLVSKLETQSALTRHLHSLLVNR